MYELKRKIGLLLGDKKEFIKRSRIINKILSVINLRHSKKRNVSVRNYGVEALRLIYEECRKENVDIWLDFGTLLGYFREKGFISYDIDLDLGAFYKDIDIFRKIKSRLMQKGFVYSRKFEYADKIVEESYSYHGLNIDIVYYDFDEETRDIGSILIVYGMDMNKRPTDIRGYTEKNKLGRLETVMFMNIPVQIPENTEEYLANYYGKDFMTPIPNFDWKATGLYVELNDSSMCKARVYNE